MCMVGCTDFRPIGAQKVRRAMSGQLNADSSSIELRITEISQLFHTLDPFPFRDKDLDKDAEEFIVGWARETPTDRPLRIVVHLPEAQARTPSATMLPEALRDRKSTRLNSSHSQISYAV